jgi:hypothetical protein
LYESRVIHAQGGLSHAYLAATLAGAPIVRAPSGGLISHPILGLVHEPRTGCKQDGLLGTYIDSYEAAMRSADYARTKEVQIRLVADFGCWLTNRQIEPQEITAELFRPYLK